MKFTPDVIVTVIGFIIFIPSFAFQMFRIYKKGKHTVNFSPTSWTLNFIGRFLWIAYGLFFGAASKDNQGLALLTVIGQGLVTLMTIPILYYTFRNHPYKGEYAKSNFNKKLFAIRMGLLVFILASILVACLGIMGTFNVGKMPSAGLLAFALSCTFFTSVAFLPQTIKTIKNKNTTSTSFFLSFLFAVGNTLLILAFLLKIINYKHDYWLIGDPVGVKTLSDACVSYVGIVILPVPTIILMFWVAAIKFANHRKTGEAL